MAKVSSKDIETLKDLKNAVVNPNVEALANNAKVRNPALEVESALTDFLTNKLEKLSRDDDFSDLIKMHIRQRLSEATFEELIKLSHEANTDHTKAMQATLELFKNETSGKNIIDNLKDNGVASTAQQLYDSTDNKDILQAVSYLSQVVGKLQQNQTSIPVDVNNKY